jgi:hypothetical protein
MHKQQETAQYHVLAVPFVLVAGGGLEPTTFGL